MSTPIFTDKDYLDERFNDTINRLDDLRARLDDLKMVPQDIAVLKDWRTSHTGDHRRAVKRNWTAAGLVVAIAGLVAKLAGVA